MPDTDTPTGHRLYPQVVTRAADVRRQLETAPVAQAIRDHALDQLDAGMQLVAEVDERWGDDSYAPSPWDVWRAFLLGRLADVHPTLDLDASTRLAGLLLLNRTWTRTTA